MGATAAQLLGVRRVRLYQSCVFIKEPGMGDTNWHSGAHTLGRRVPAQTGCKQR